MTTTATTATRTLTPAECARKRRRARGLAVVAATAATFTVWTVAHQIAGVDLVVDSGSGATTVTPRAVVLVTVLAGLAAWGLLALLERSTSRGTRIWTWIASAVLAVSLLGPVGSADGTGATLALLAMHLATGAVLIPIMARSNRHPA
ncbi:hypothetical protein Ais01nite_80250 [Asanoa ishikariensis]|uniref:Uncharacterized protein n=1 Tax=Asanoa ishikariensis TaxID=137265 RepID=A0A1H3UZC0_9ACTN|nr:DUF6069 family protein [Asanoa ishikariensis]GIF69990.1 hypothetical protein Ais01nite_80250 [Asanoa ishikariensis]SDZ67169.1 hypothetical protein SAMN05421684_8367 [Asanoa ishikariensis]